VVDSDNMMPGSREKAKDSDDKPVERDRDAWMDTLSDLIFLMITFFVLLITMSSMDHRSLKEAFGMFNEASGVMNFPDPHNGEETFIQIMTPIGDIENVARTKDGRTVDLAVARDEAERFLKGVRDGLMNPKEKERLYSTLKPMAEKLGSDVQILRIKDGVEVVLAGRLLFPYGSKELDEKGKKLLDDVAVILQLWGGDVKLIAMWPWYEASDILTEIVMALQQRRIQGKKMKPEMFNDMQRKIRFVLRKDKDDGQ
jgi:flagellar motor protein MotB